MSALLQRKVAEEVSGILHASRIMMTATHTHAGVGHFFGASQYTGLFSSRLPGYDEKLMHTLAGRIAKAIREAAENAQPAKLRWSHHDDFWCFTRNRSLGAYRLNRPRYAPAPPALPCLRGRPDLAAIDPNLHVLRIDASGAGPPRPIGSISFFAMHPTVVRNDNQLFGGDAMGIVSRHVERELRRQWCQPDDATAKARCGSRASAPPPDPLHGVINTNEGDIAPIWSRGDVDEAIGVGEAVGEFVWQAHPSLGSGSASPIIDSRYVEEDIRGVRFVDQGADFLTCPFPEVGQGAARGGTDHRTSVASIPMFGSEPPVDFTSKSCQTPKRPLLGPLSLTTRPKGVLPSHLPLAVVLVDDVLLSFVPAELTVTAGHRLTDRVLNETAGYAGAPKHAVVAGLANEYIQYVATEEEYDLQEYEGASTLYGSASARYLANRMTLLARAIFDDGVAEWLRKNGMPLGVAKEIDFSFGPRVDRLEEASGDALARKHLGTCTMPSAGGPRRICMYWQDGGPGDVGLQATQWVSVVHDDSGRAPVKLCLAPAGATCDPGGFVDDRGYEFRTRIHDEVDGSWLWSTLFTPSAATSRELSRSSVRIQVGAGGPRVESSAFSSQCEPPRCTARQARLCIDGARTDNWEGLVAASD